MHVEPPAIASWATLDNASHHLRWYPNRGERELLFFISILFVGELLNGYDGTIVGGLIALPKWHEDLNYPSSAQIGLLNAAAFITGIMMRPLNSFIIDRYGRRWAVRWFGLTMVIGTALGCVAGIKPDIGYPLFVTSKAIIGAGLTCFLMTAPIMMQEIVSSKSVGSLHETHPRNRASMCALWAAMWVVGNFIAGWTTFGCSFIQTSWSWRTPYLVQMIPAAYILFACSFVPETPRYLMAQGDEKGALDFFVKYHGNGNPQDPLVLFEFTELKQTLEAEVGEREVKWSELFKMKGNKHRVGLVCLMTLMPQMNGSNVVQYYYSVVLSLVGISGPTILTGIGAGLSMLGFVCQLVGVWVLARIKRRSMVLYTWPVLIVCMAVLEATGALYEQGNVGAGIGSVVMVWLFTIPFSFVTPLFYSYPTEILNYAIRGKGMAVWNTVNQGWGAYGSFVNSVALGAIGWRYYLIYLPVLIGQFILAYFYMVETKGFTLEEIAVAFEGKDAAVGQTGIPIQRTGSLDKAETYMVNNVDSVEEKAQYVLDA